MENLLVDLLNSRSETCVVNKKIHFLFICLLHYGRVELVSTQVTKVTVGRLHFSETTSNNMRKKGKPNPEQRYFQVRWFYFFDDFLLNLRVTVGSRSSRPHFPWELPGYKSRESEDNRKGESLSFIGTPRYSNLKFLKASNPGQFENDVELIWQKGQTQVRNPITSRNNKY